MWPCSRTQVNTLFFYMFSFSSLLLKIASDMLHLTFSLVSPSYTIIQHGFEGRWELVTSSFALSGASDQSDENSLSSCQKIRMC